MQQRSRAVENHFNNDRFDESQGPRGRHSDLSHEADLVLRTCGGCSMLSAVTWLLPIDSHQNFRAARATKLFCDKCFASMKKKCVTGPTCSHTAFADESNREFCALREECMLCVCVCVSVWDKPTNIARPDSLQGESIQGSLGFVRGGLDFIKVCELVTHPTISNDSALCNIPRPCMARLLLKARQATRCFAMLRAEESVVAARTHSAARS